MKIEETTYLCDFCVSTPPTVRYSIPYGTPVLEWEDAATKERKRIISAGSFGVCDDCNKLLRSGGSVQWRATRFAIRVLRVAPAFRFITQAEKAVFKTQLIRCYSRLIPLLSNPRPCVRGEEPLDAKLLHLSKEDLQKKEMK